MRSFSSLSLVLCIFLLFCSFCQAQRSHKRGQPPAQHRRANSPYGFYDAKNKRETNVVFTYFVDGLGACGATNAASDFIVAVNSNDFAGGAHCFEMITVTVNGKSAQAQIMDQCSTCAPGGLDFSEGLFQHFAPLDTGELQGSWVFNSDLTTSSSTPPPTSTSHTPTPTSTTSPTSSAASSTSTSSTSTSAPTPTPVPQQGPQVITELNLGLVEYGALLQALFNFSS